MSNLSKPGAGLWNCYVVQDEQTGRYIAHCLEFDIKVTGSSTDQAWDRLKKTLKAFYEYAYSSDPDALDVTASNPEWDWYNRELRTALRDHPGSVTVETIELVLHPPKLPERVFPLSFQRVNLAAQAPVDVQ